MQVQANQKDYAIILAGGKSSRMGQDKALLKVGQQTLLEYVYQAVKPLVSQSVIMLAQAQDIKNVTDKLKGHIIIGRDSQLEQGPLQGIADAMALLPPTGQFVYVVSCDLPYLTTVWLDGLKQILMQSKEAEIVCSSLDGFRNPLIAIYRHFVIRKADSLISQGKRSCLALLDDQIVISKEPEKVDSIVVSNINTPDEYQQVLDGLDLHDY